MLLISTDSFIHVSSFHLLKWEKVSTVSEWTHYIIFFALFCTLRPLDLEAWLMHFASHHSTNAVFSKQAQKSGDGVSVAISSRSDHGLKKNPLSQHIPPETHFLLQYVTVHVTF